VAARWNKDFRFVAAAFSANDLVVALTSVEAAEEMEDLTIVAAWRDPKWVTLDQAYPWSVVDSVTVATQGPSAVLLGLSGEILFTDGQNAAEESIAPASDDSPPDRGLMCGLGLVENTLYAVGMGRQVYRRDQGGNWSCIDHAIRPTADDESIVGLTSIDGFSARELYSAGFNGEIWWCADGGWLQVDSPTNLPLTRVLGHDDGNVYICGRNGTLLRGRADRWSVIAEEETDDDLWSIVAYHGRIYVVGTHGLYLLEKDRLILVPIPGESLGFCQRLLVGNDRLWVLGPQDLLAFDGKTWRRIG
jgi:hypothetical protein